MLDSIFTIEKRIPKKDFLQIVLNIPYDVAIGNVKKYEKLTEHAILISRKLKDSISLADCYIQKALALHYTSKDAEAINLSIKAIRIYEKFHQIEKMGTAYCKLSWKLKHRNYEKAILYMRKGIKVLKKENYLTPLSGAFDNYGVLLGMQKNGIVPFFFTKNHYT